MTDLRVLVVNDSPTVRAALRTALEAHPNVRVVGEIGDGTAVVDAALRLRPSVILMDAVMPHCDGYEATRAVMARAPTPVVMVSAVEDARHEHVVLRALGAGALAIVGLPPGPGDPLHRSRWAALVQLLRTMAGARLGPAAPFEEQAPVEARGPARRPANASGIAAIALVASAGGPQALASVLLALADADLPPVLLVQHMAPGFTSGFASWLEGETKRSVRLARTGEQLVPGVVYLAPEERHLEVASDGTALVRDLPPVRGFRPSADVLLSSLAKVYGERAIAVVLTGMGSDGAQGAAELRAAGGTVIAESSQTAVIDGMPRAVRDRGAASKVLALPAIAGGLRELLGGGH